MSINNTLKELLKETSEEIATKFNKEIELKYYNDNNEIYYLTNIIKELNKMVYINSKELFNRIKEKIIRNNIIKNIDLLEDNTIKITIKEEYLIERLKRILKEDKDYGKNNIGNNKKINIELSIIDEVIDINKSLNTIITIDNYSRILSYCGYDIEKEIYINNNNIDKEEIKILLDKYRIYIDRYSDNKEIEDSYQIEDLLNKIRYQNICYIDNNSLLLCNKELIDNMGNYTDFAKYLTHIYEKYNNYEKIVIYNNDRSIEEALKLLNLDLEKIKINNIEEKNIIQENINYTRYKCIINEESEKNLIKITTYINKINKCMKSIENNKEVYNNANNNIIYNIINKLTDFEDIIIESYQKEDLKIIIDYLLELISLINIIIERKSFNNINILNMFNASKIVINNSLNIIGLIPIDEI